LCTQVFLIVKGYSFGVELYGALDIFDGGLGSAVPGLALFVDGGVALAPVDEVLSEAGVF
jgi:hypothetical protein